MTVQPVTSSDDLKKHLRDAGDRLVVLDFHATWCGPCKMIAPEVDSFANLYPQVLFLKVDVDECDDVASDYNIESMPTFLFIKQSQVVETLKGTNKEKLEQLILKYK